MRCFVFLFPAFGLAAALSTGDIAGKFKLAIPEIPSHRISTTSCTAFEDSSLFHYNPKFNRLDSITGTHLPKPRAYRFKETFSYTSLSNGGYSEKMKRMDLTNKEIQYEKNRTFLKDGKLVFYYDSSITNNYWVYTYDSRGNLLVEKEGADAATAVDYVRYKYDQKNRMIRMEQLGGDKKFFVAREYGVNDSLSAEIMHDPKAGVFPRRLFFYDSRKRNRMEIEYNWHSDHLPNRIKIREYNENNLVSREFLLSDTTDTDGNDLKKYGVVDCKWMEYDEKKRLKREVNKSRPMPDE